MHLECCGVSEVLCSIDLLRMYLRNHKAGNFCYIMSVEVLGRKEWCCTLIETAEQDVQFCGEFFIYLILFFYVITVLSIMNLPHPFGRVVEIFSILKYHEFCSLLKN